MRSAALLEAIARGAEAFPVLAIDLAARGFSLGRGIYSPSYRVTDLGPVTGVTAKGGWSPIVYGSGVRDNSLGVPTATVDVLDTSGELVQLLETYDPRGSAARIDAAAPGLVETDWEPLFRGILADWARKGPVIQLICKVDDTVLRRPVPSGIWSRPEWGSAYDSSIFGTAQPLVMGVHDLFKVTARGTVPLVNIRYDKDIGYWWALTASKAVSIDRLYHDGVPQGTGGWSTFDGVYGGARLKIVAYSEGYQPEKDVIVSVDCSGPDEDGLDAGDTLTGRPDQLRAVLEEFVLRTPPLAGWRGPASIIDTDSWDAVSEYCALHRMESARRFGADQQPEAGAEVVQSYLDATPWARIAWTPLGTLAHGILDPDDVDPESGNYLRLDKYHVGGQVPLEPGDRREVYTHLRQPFMWSAADQKFMSAYEAHDVAALPEKLPLSIDNVWSQARFDQDGPSLNPAPPADPEIPS